MNKPTDQHAPGSSNKTTEQPKRSDGAGQSHASDKANPAKKAPSHNDKGSPGNMKHDNSRS